MKKLLILPLLIISLAFSNPTENYAVSWASLGATQGIARNTLIDGNINDPYLWWMITGSVGRTDKLITKDTMSAVLGSMFNSAYPLFANKTAKQIICKRDLTFALSVSTAHGATVCAAYSGSQTLYCDLTLTRFYTNSALTTPFVGGGDYYYIAAVGVSLIINSSGYSSSITFC
jgi:hypothetical protein